MIKTKNPLFSSFRRQVVLLLVAAEVPADMVVHPHVSPEEDVPRREVVVAEGLHLQLVDPDLGLLLGPITFDLPPKPMLCHFPRLILHMF